MRMMGKKEETAAEAVMFSATVKPKRKGAKDATPCANYNDYTGRYNDDDDEYDDRGGPKRGGYRGR
eukprot:1689918-Rhodomonas_salina.1